MLVRKIHPHVEKKAPPRPKDERPEIASARKADLPTVFKFPAFRQLRFRSGHDAGKRVPTRRSARRSACFRRSRRGEDRVVADAARDRELLLSHDHRGVPKVNRRSSDRGGANVFRIRGQKDVDLEFTAAAFQVGPDERVGPPAHEVVPARGNARERWIPPQRQLGCEGEGARGRGGRYERHTSSCQTS